MLQFGLNIISAVIMNEVTLKNCMIIGRVNVMMPLRTPTIKFCSLFKVRHVFRLRANFV